MKKYLVKTRNWSGNKILKKLLDLSLYCGADKNGDFSDNDEKYFFETNFFLSAIFVLVFYKLLSRWSRGWTYLLNQNKKFSMHDYRTFYL